MYGKIKYKVKLHIAGVLQTIFRDKRYRCQILCAPMPFLVFKHVEHLLIRLKYITSAETSMSAYPDASRKMGKPFSKEIM